jgi:hypothetical protein
MTTFSGCQSLCVSMMRAPISRLAPSRLFLAAKRTPPFAVTLDNHFAFALFAPRTARKPAARRPARPPI